MHGRATPAFPMPGVTDGSPPLAGSTAGTLTPAMPLPLGTSCGPPSSISPAPPGLQATRGRGNTYWLPLPDDGVIESMVWL